MEDLKSLKFQKTPVSTVLFSKRVRYLRVTRYATLFPPLP